MQGAPPSMRMENGQQQTRPALPTRSSTVGSPGDFERNRLKGNNDIHPHARSEDLNHSSHSYNQHMLSDGTNGNGLGSSPTGSPMPSFQSLSRPLTPNDSHSRSGASSSAHSDHGVPGDDTTLKRMSTASLISGLSSTAASTSGSKAGSSVSATTTLVMTTCAACSLPLEGAFVRALGNVWHLNCFKCRDCDVVVASKFFPIDGPDGKQLPLCERDYFRRLSLICSKCGQALRGSYITACNKKYHVEHFTCSVCPTVFGPQDSYYEHENDVYCHFHYSTRFATKCAGCNSAILKQFVEINRNNRDECWHPECYMINKFWNVKISSRRTLSPSVSTIDVNDPVWKEEEERESPQSLKEKQSRMEQEVYRIWTVLSAFEESSAACISDMLRQVSNGQYLEAIRMAEKFILHVEVLFATIDDLEAYFARLNLKGMSHVREARLLCRKTVELFTLLSKAQDSQRRTGMTQELLALVTGLAHYLKILIRIALTGGLKLERDYDLRDAMTNFLDKLHLLAVEGGNPSARRLMRGGEKHTGDHGGAYSTQGVTYGFRSLTPEFAGDSPFNDSPDSTVPLIERLSMQPPSDLCVKCRKTVEEDSVRLGTYRRWHSQCLDCATCGKMSAPPTPKDPVQQKDGNSDEKDNAAPKISLSRRPPANAEFFVYDPQSASDDASQSYGPSPKITYCLDHKQPSCLGGFQAVSRLEQYAYLLTVALRRLSFLLKKQGLLIPPQPTTPQNRDAADSNAYRDSGDIMRMKSVHLDRKVSATARLPKRSTIVESPSGKTAQPTNVANVMQRSAGPAAQPQVATSSAAAPMASLRSPRPGQQPPTSPQPPSQSQGPPTRPQLAPPGMLGAGGGILDDKGQVIRPSFARNNTGVMIVDESAPNSPSGGVDEPPLNAPDNGITLADIPQLLEVEEARQQHRALPSQSHVPLVAELTPLELMIVKHSAVLALCRSPLKNEFEIDDLLEFIEVKKNNFWNKLFKGNKQKKGVFGVPLEILVEREGADSVLGASRATLRVPSFIDDVISAMRQMDMSVEGIFRKNGNIRRLNELTEQIDRDPSSVDLTQDNPVQLAALLKKFLKSLPEPLMTYKLYRLFMAAENLTNEDERRRCLHLVMLLLPKGNRDTVEVLFTFLKWVASFSHVDEETGNRMDLHNLATVISPNIFRSSPAKGTDSVRLESLESIRVMDSLLEHQDEFYQVPEDFLPLLRDQDYFSNSTELPSKEFLKKCEAYHRVRPHITTNGRNHGMTSPIQGSNITPGASSQFNMSNSASGSFVSTPSEQRLLPQKSDPSLSRGRAQQQQFPHDHARNGFYTSAPQSLERGQGQSSMHQARPQSPPPASPPQPPRLQHQPFSHPMPNSTGALPMAQSQQGPLNQDLEWPGHLQPTQGQSRMQMQPLSMSAPSSGPISPASYTPRSSGELGSRDGLNAHTPMQFRQRT